MSHPSSAPDARTGGMLFGLLGVLSFSLTLPASRIAVAGLDPVIVGLGRSIVAACLAAPFLLVTRQVRPTWPQLKSLSLVILGVVFGFPFLSAWAMQRVPSSHGAVVLGLLPLATAVAGVLRTHERPSLTFWIASVAGSLTVVVFSLSTGGGGFHPADLALLAAVILAALGYAEGARLTRQMGGGWQVISWALVLGAPFLVLPVGLAINHHGLHAPLASWLAFGYVSVFSAFLGFFAWYRGLSIGGVARVGQVQLLQPFLTMGFATLLLSEPFSFTGVGVAALVSLSILVTRNSREKKAPVIGASSSTD